MKTYRIIKEIQAKNIKSALKELEKASVVSIQEVQNDRSTDELTPAIGFEVYTESDYDEEYNRRRI